MAAAQIAWPLNLNMQMTSRKYFHRCTSRMLFKVFEAGVNHNESSFPCRPMMTSRILLASGPPLGNFLSTFECSRKSMNGYVFIDFTAHSTDRFQLFVDKSFDSICENERGVIIESSTDIG